MKAKTVCVILCCLSAALASSKRSLALSPAQEKLMAKRAAQADAYRKLTEEIKGLRIDANTYVRDYIAESDQVTTAFSDFMKGLRIDGLPRYLPDGSCEVDVKVTLKQIMQGLKRIHMQYPDGRSIDFDKMGEYTKKTVFTATGVGLPPSQRPESAAEENISLKTAGIPGWENVTTQGRLLAERGALTDARRNLAETVKGLRISGNTYVRDFVVESDQIQTDLNTFINGIKESGPYRYLRDAICEVGVEVTIQDVVKELKKIRKTYVAGFPPQSIYRDIEFERIVDWGPPKTIRATGSAAVPERGYIKGGEPAPESPAVTSRFINNSPSIPLWSKKTVTATGTGVPNSGDEGTIARLNAQRAAEADARRNLAEKVYGVQIDAKTTVRDYMTVGDEVRAEVTRFLAGARVLGEPRIMPDGTVEVTMELPLDGLWGIVRKNSLN